MALVETTLFGIEDKVALAIERIRHFERQALAMNPDGYFVAFSGGKDSIVVMDLIRRAGVKHTAHFHMTTVDPPELLDFIREHYDGAVKWERPKISMFQLIKKKMMPPTRIVRFCCDHLKERGGEGRMVVTGVRWAESAKRSKRQMVESCFRDNTKMYLHPIIEWSDDDVWQYIRERPLPYCKLYDEGFKRIGCVGCPMAGAGRIAEFKRWPRFEIMYKRAFAAAASRNLAKGRPEWVKEHPLIANWTDGEKMFDWWMSEHRADDNETGSLFE